MEEHFSSCDKFSEKMRQDAVLCLRTLLGLEKESTAYVPAVQMLGTVERKLVNMIDARNCLAAIIVILKKLLFGADEPWPFRTHFVCLANGAPITMYYTIETLPDIYIVISEATLQIPESLTIQLCHQLCRLLILKQTEDIYTDHGIPLDERLQSLQEILKLPNNLVSEKFQCCSNKRTKPNHQIDAELDQLYLFYSLQAGFPIPLHMKAMHILSKNDLVGGSMIIMKTMITYWYSQVKRAKIQMNGVDTAVDICKIGTETGAKKICLVIYQKAYTNFDDFSEAMLHQFSRVQLYFKEKLNHLPSCADDRLKEMLKKVGKFLRSPTRPRYYCCHSDFKPDFEDFNDFLHFLKSLSLDFTKQNRHSKAADFILNYDESKHVLMPAFLLQGYITFGLIEKPFNNNRIIFVDHLYCSEGLTVWTGNRHKEVTILLSHEVVNKPETLRDVLLHQLCLVDVGNSKESFSNHGLKYVAKIRNVRNKLPFPMRYFRVKSGCCNTLVNIPCSETKYFLKSILMQKLNKCHREAKLTFNDFQTYYPILTELLTHVFDKIMFDNALASYIELLLRTDISQSGNTKPRFLHFLKYSPDSGQLPCVQLKYERYTLELNSLYHQSPTLVLLTILHEMCHVAELHLDRVVNEDHGLTWHTRVFECYTKFPAIPRSQQFCKDNMLEFHHYICRYCNKQTSLPQLIDVRRELCENCSTVSLRLLRIDLNCVRHNL